ncbi:MAG: M15 family metallopeptidase [Clostridia bacterium]|nr:M15 family metallopeptidase [Clostridia bacterium]
MKRNKFLKIAVCLLALLCLFSACKRQPEPETPNEKQDPAPVEVVYTYKTDVDESILCTSLSESYLFLANKEHPMSSGYAPNNLAAYTGKTYYDKEVYLEERVAKAVLAMVEEMKADGVTDIMVTSGYRSYAYQKNLYENYILVEMNGISKEAKTYLGEDYINENYTKKGLSKLNRSDAIRVVDSYSAKAGYSEHQTGLCIDFITSTMRELDVTFEGTSAFRWLKENAHKFGFILRYPKEKEDVTGYSYEPWHYRFVGREAATEIYEKGITLEEFLLAR